ncbi:DNA-binding response regulator, NarL/FixJ family, contains REC and HTH domains [Amycolatopsis xylanica]|uniref:DNA-binding response regulator, NarL/FixJ family, contains REC and HTH domains n=1 Tax=Amycolatopsis xylanica TaxID=589385 RepID=A0A1H3NGN4_9PSEU|nr:AAA family ATPase [Amycolatopsis xylanica]SDY87820.1 DNA-binding response regulator, NarL/FixJ family, contains REC and HTH domains [Amycolatopsis xylanica]
MRLAERGSEWETLNSAYGQAARRQGRVVAVGGPGGTGKSALLRAFAAHAAAEGAVVFSAAGSASDHRLPLGLAMELFRSAALPAGLASRVEAALKPESFTEHAAELCAAILELAQHTTVVLTVDDLQYADVESLRVLLYLQRRIASARVLIVLSEWQQPRSVHSMVYAELMRSREIIRVTVAPLSLKAVTEVLKSELDQLTVARLATSFHAVCGGNPFLLRALIEDHLARAEAGPHLIVGRHATHALLTCLTRWEPRLLEVARGVAVLGEYSSAAALAQLLEIEPAAVAQALTALNATGMLDDCRFRHPEFRAAVLAEMDDEGESALFVRAATVLYHEGATASHIADHLLSAGPVEQDWVVEVLQEAATHAIAEDDVLRAVDCLELAQQVCDDERRRAGLTAMLARVQGLTNPAANVRLLAPLRSPAAQAEVRRRLLGDGESAEDTARVAAELELTAKWVRFAHPPVLTVLEGGATGEHHEPVPATELDADNLTTFIGPDAVVSAEQVLQSARVGDTTLEAVLSALFTLIYTGSAAKAGQWCETLGAQARAQRAKAWTAALADVRSHIALRDGDVAAAERHAAQALTEMSAKSWGVAVGSPLAHRLYALTAMNKLEAAEELLEFPLPDGITETRYWPLFLHARGRFHLATGRLHAALADFRTCGALLEDWGLDFPAFLPWRGDLARVYVRLGRTQTARDLITAQLRLPTGDVTRVRGTSLRALAAASEPHERVEILTEAVPALQECGDLVELAHALGELGRTHHLLGDYGKARLLVRRASEIAAGCQVELTADETLDSLPSVVHNETLSLLSEAERRVASLAAQGHTNREISRQLFITMSTVEQHLTRIYRKLNVTTRSALAAELPMALATTAS